MNTKSNKFFVFLCKATLLATRTTRRSTSTISPPGSKPSRRENSRSGFEGHITFDTVNLWMHETIYIKPAEMLWLLIGSVTFLRPALSVLWLVGQSVGWSVKISSTGTAGSYTSNLLSERLFVKNLILSFFIMAVLSKIIL